VRRRRGEIPREARDRRGAVDGADRVQLVPDEVRCVGPHVPRVVDDGGRVHAEQRRLLARHEQDVRAGIELEALRATFLRGVMTAREGRVVEHGELRRGTAGAAPTVRGRCEHVDVGRAGVGDDEPLAVRRETQAVRIGRGLEDGDRLRIVTERGTL
jgi:hypothetical protein